MLPGGASLTGPTIDNALSRQEREKHQGISGGVIPK